MYLIIGSGRAALHISHYLSLLGVSGVSWNRKENSVQDLHDKLKKADKVLLLISDSALESFYKTHLTDFKGPVIHMSGALEMDGMTSAHPLMTFGPFVNDLGVYKKMAFAMSPGATLGEVLPELPNASFVISSEDRALYHAWAVYAGNLATLLWQEALPGFEKLGVPSSAVAVYLEQILANALAAPQISLTGPLARKDKITIDRHLEALPHSARELYLGFVRQYAPEVLP